MPLCSHCNRQSCCCSTATHDYTHSQWTGVVDPEFQYKQRNSVVTLTRVAKRTRAPRARTQTPTARTIVPSCRAFTLTAAKRVGCCDELCPVRIRMQLTRQSCLKMKLSSCEKSFHSSSTVGKGGKHPLPSGYRERHQHLDGRSFAWVRVRSPGRVLAQTRVAVGLPPVLECVRLSRLRLCRF
jgi:hypothetical protein